MRTLDARTLEGRVLDHPPVTPLDYPVDLNGWWDASTLTLANGATVASWPDLSGNGNHFAQATVGNRPTFAAHAHNGRGAVRFDDAQNTFMATPTFAAVAQPVTVIVVCLSNSAAGYAILDTPSGEGNRNAISASDGSGDDLAVYAGGPAFALPQLAGATWSLGAVYGLVRNPSGFIWRTSTPAADWDEGNPGSSSGPTAWMIGRHTTTTTRRFDGDICEMAIWGRQLPLLDVSKLIQAWAVKWGF